MQASRRPIVSAAEIIRSADRPGSGRVIETVRIQSDAERALADAILIGMAAAGMSRTYLAMKAGLPRAVLTAQLAGRRFLSRATAEACAAVLDIRLPDAYPVPKAGLRPGQKTPRNLARFVTKPLDARSSLEHRIARAIDVARVGLGWTVDALSIKAGYHWRRVGNILRQRQPMTLIEAEDLCSAVGIRLEIVVQQKEVGK